jgi:REP element-mobilizing transposase RayT
LEISSYSNLYGNRKFAKHYFLRKQLGSDSIKIAIHAYVLMPNHFQLLATPETADGLLQMMQAVGRLHQCVANAHPAAGE